MSSFARSFPPLESIAITRDGIADVPMVRQHEAGIFEATLPAGDGVPDYRLRVTYPGGETVEIDDPYRYGRVITDYDLYLFGEGKHTRIYDRLGAHPMRIGETAGVHFAVWAPNARARQRRRRLQRVGRPRASDAVARRERRLGDLHPRCARGAAVQVRDPRAGRRACW